MSGWQERGSTFKYQKIHFEIPILLHTEPRLYFNIAGNVLKSTEYEGY